MTGISEKERTAANQDFDLGVVGFKFSDLFDAVRLRELAEKFYDELKEENALLHDALTKYIAARGAGYEARVESNILTDSAPYLSRFVAKMFGITREREQLEREITEQSPIWKYKFFVQRRAIKKYTAEKIGELNENELNEALREFKFAAFDEALVYDEELAVSYITDRLVEAEEALTKGQEITPATQETLNKIAKAYDKLQDKNFGKVFERNIIEIEGTGEVLQVKAVLQMLEAWSAIQFHGRRKKWYSFKVPHGLDYQNLVHLIHPEPKLHNIMRGKSEEMRRRDGFKLTDDRGTMRDALYEVDYCLICHERDKDSCSKGLR
jgi:hypothetical protein